MSDSAADNGGRFVERPTTRPRMKYRYSIEDLLATATNGQAIRVPLNGATQQTARNALKSIARYHGFCLRARADGDALLCWVEPRA